MKTVIMYKYHNPDKLFGGWRWSTTKIWDKWNHIYSEPYEVEIPDDFYLGQSVTGEEIYFKVGCKQGYNLVIGRANCENSSPFLIGGCPIEKIRLKVIGKVKKDDVC